MTYATLLVHVQAGRSNGPLLKVVGQFADRFGADVIGVAACQPLMVVSGDGFVCGGVFEEDQRRVGDDLKAAEREFRDALRGIAPRLDWRSSVTVSTVADYLSAEARCADLVMTGATPGDTLSVSRLADVGGLVMQAGRPVLLVPKESKPLLFDHAVVGWTDTRESRRAALDALPLLKRFARVTVMEIAEFDDVDATHARVEDVVGWLGRHGVTAGSRVERTTGHAVEQLFAVIDEVGAGLIVAGAYGHSRFREWVIGGVTRNLLLDSQRCALVSH